jgi:O-antigen/teichoic acid export membrane protein
VTTPIARLRQNMRVLVSANVVVICLGMLTLALNARALNPAGLGVLALLVAWVAVAGRLFSFETWQGLIKFGGEALEEDDYECLRTFATIALYVDLATGFIAAITSIAILLAAGDLLALPSKYLLPSALFLGSLFIQLPGAPVGLMRLQNRFALQGSIAIAEGALRLAFAALFFARGSPLIAYLYSYAGVLFAINGVRMYLFFKLLREATSSARLAPMSATRVYLRPFLGFSVGSWTAATLNVLRQHGTTFVVTAFYGAAGAGMYSIAQRLVAPITYVAEPLRQAIYPELARLVAQKKSKHVRHLVRSTLLLTAFIAAVAIVFFGRPAIELVAGPGYQDAYGILVGLGLSGCLFLCMPAFSSLVLLYAGVKPFTLASILGTIAWAASLLIGLFAWGIAAAGLAQIAFVVTVFAANGYVLSRLPRADSLEVTPLR